MTTRSKGHTRTQRGEPKWSEKMDRNYWTPIRPPLWQKKKTVEKRGGIERRSEMGLRKGRKDEV